MTSQIGQKIIVIDILPNLSKDNQTVKFGQLIEYNMGNIFLKKSYAKSIGESSPRSFYKTLKLSMSFNQQSEMSRSLLLLYGQVEVYQNILKLRCWPLAFTLYKAFSKKVVWNTLPTSFTAWFFEKKYFWHYILLTDQISLRNCF